jgi:hypothetical protein
MGTGSAGTCVCGRGYDAEGWEGLALFTELSATDLAAHVTPWPPHLVVQVRVCRSCGHKLSRITELTAWRQALAAAVA